MTTIIDKLTKKQESRLEEWAAKWTAIGLSTEPADFDAAEAGVRACYLAAKLSSPNTILRLGSPVGAITGGMAATLALKKVDPQDKKAVRSAVSSAVYSAVESAGDSAVESSVSSAVYSAVGSAVSSAVSSAVKSAVKSAVSSAGYQYRYGNLGAGWHGYVTFFRDVCGLRLPCFDAYAADEMVALNACLVWYGDQVAAISDRPEQIYTQDGRTHRIDGPAIVFRDGWKIWCIEGVNVTEQIVMAPETLTPAEIFAEKNEEVRRIMIDRFGWPRLVTASGSVQLHKRYRERDGQWEELYRLPDGQQRLVVSDPSTGRRYFLGCPADIQTCDQAQNFISHGLDGRAVHRS